MLKIIFISFALMCWNSHLHTHTKSTFIKNPYENLNAGQICFSLLQILRKMFCALTSRQVAASCLSLFKGAAPQFQPLQHYCPHTATRPPVRPYQGCTTNQPTQPINQHNQPANTINTTNKYQYIKRKYVILFTSTLQYTKIYDQQPPQYLKWLVDIWKRCVSC